MSKFFDEFKAGLGIGAGVTFGSLITAKLLSVGMEAYDKRFGNKETSTSTPELATEPKTGDDGLEEVK